MSSNNDEDKPEGNKLFPLDLASKVTMKSLEVGKGTPLVMTAQPLRGMRVLAHTAVTGGNSNASVTGPTISIVPQAVIKQGDTLQRTQIGIINNHGQGQSSSGVAVARPTQITLTNVVAQSQTGGATYHVPRGPAVVANLATPRSAVATPIRGPGISTTPPGQSATGFVTAIRQVAPPRTPSPATTALPAGTTWLPSSSMQVQGGTVKNINTTVLNSGVQRVPVAVTPVASRTQVVARAQPLNTGVRSAILHPSIPLGQSTQLHSLKPAGGLTSVGNTVTLAQVMPARTQTLVYSGTSTQHFSAAPRLAVASGIPSRQVTAARPGQVMATRLAVPVTLSGPSSRLVGQGTVYTTGARLSTVAAPVQSTVLGGNTRIAVSNNQSTALSRLSVTTPAALLTTTPTRITVANSTHAAPQPGSAVVITTQAGRLAASVVSLHPVVMANTGQTTRTLQAQGPKVIAQQTQGTSLQLAQVPSVAKIPQQATVLPVTVTVAATPTSRTINVTPATIVSQRPVNVSASQTIPIAKVFPQGNRATVETSDGTTNVQNNPTNVYIHTTPVVRRTSPGPMNVAQSENQRTPVTTGVASYTLSSGTAYYYDSSSGYTVGGNNFVARPFTPSTGSFTAVQQNTPTQIRTTGLATQVHGIMNAQSIQFNPVMVVEQKRGTATQFLESNVLQQSPNTQDHSNQVPSIGKVTSSPRPSILRKRDNEGSPLKAAKNLTPVLATLSAPVSPPSRPESRGNGQSSGGSTTISATSSPGLGEQGEDSLPLPPTINKIEHDDDKPLQEMSPRKKPRKQQLTGNDLHEPKFNIEDMQFLSDNKIKKELDDSVVPQRKLILSPENHPEVKSEVTVKKPAPASLLNSYRLTWKSTHNHYLRYTDVKPKDERRPTIMDLANQSHVLQKINGWKIYHLSTQMEDLSDLEAQVYDKLTSMLKLMETKESTGHDRDVNRINELIKGNMQRSKIINDGMVEAKSSVMKIFDHKEHVADIINRCASKRNFKKRDKF